MKEAEDPCECASEVSADFDILEQSWNTADAFYTKTDAVLADKRVYFRAKEENAEYTWYIGIDEETDQETWKYFGEQWVGSTIPITLVVKKIPNLTCFPDDDGYDSITKTFTVHDRCEPNIMEGTFRIAEENSLDSFDIVLNFDEAYDVPGIQWDSGCRRLDFYNYDGQGSDCVDYNNTMLRNFREFRRLNFSSINGNPIDCDLLFIRECENNLNGEFRINYATGASSLNNLREFNCFGRKLN